MPKIIGIDCDDVLSETMCEILKTSFFVEKGIKREDLICYNLWENPKLGLNFEEAKQVFSDFFDSEQYRNAQPMKWAREKLELRKAQGHQLILVTGREISFKERTVQWVNQHFPLLFDDFLFSNHNTGDKIPKSELCKQLGIQVMVEDYWDFALEVSQKWILCFLLDKPWGRSPNWEQDPNIINVDSREEIDLSLIP